MKKILVLGLFIMLAFPALCLAANGGRITVTAPNGQTCDVWDYLVQSKGGGSYEVVYKADYGNDGANCRAAGSRAVVHHFEIGDTISKNASAAAPAMSEPAAAPKPAAAPPEPIVAPAEPKEAAPADEDDWGDDWGDDDDDEDYLFDE